MTEQVDVYTLTSKILDTVQAAPDAATIDAEIRAIEAVMVTAPPALRDQLHTVFRTLMWARSPNHFVPPRVFEFDVGVHFADCEEVAKAAVVEYRLLVVQYLQAKEQKWRQSAQRDVGVAAEAASFYAAACNNAAHGVAAGGPERMLRERAT